MWQKIMRSINNTRGDTGKRFSEQLKKEVAIAISMGKITLAEARKLINMLAGSIFRGKGAENQPQRKTDSNFPRESYR
jgi:hypothetical protein